MSDASEKNAALAGWNHEDGPAPFEHGAPVDPLDEDTDLEALVKRAEAKG